MPLVARRSRHRFSPASRSRHGRDAALTRIRECGSRAGCPDGVPRPPWPTGLASASAIPRLPLRLASAPRIDRRPPRRPCQAQRARGEVRRGPRNGVTGTLRSFGRAPSNIRSWILTLRPGCLTWLARREPKGSHCLDRGARIEPIGLEKTRSQPPRPAPRRPRPAERTRLAGAPACGLARRDCLSNKPRRPRRKVGSSSGAVRLR